MFLFFFFGTCIERLYDSFKPTLYRIGHREFNTTIIPFIVIEDCKIIQRNIPLDAMLYTHVINFNCEQIASSLRPGFVYDLRRAIIEEKG